MAEHTPGPWVAIEAGPCLVIDASHWDVYQQGGDNVFCMARMAAADETEEANARLIASAPELKAENTRLKDINAEMCAAIERVIPVLAGIVQAYGTGPAGQVFEAMHDELAAAVAKATGQGVEA